MISKTMFLSKKKFRLFFIVLLITSPSVMLGQSVNNDTLRVLAIGNSFSQGAIEQNLHELAAAAGKHIIIGNLYIGGAPLSLHWQNIQGNKNAYSYRKISTDGHKTTTPTFPT